MKQIPVSIVSTSSLSPLGFGPEACWDVYGNEDHILTPIQPALPSERFWGKLPEHLAGMLSDVRNTNAAYQHLDPNVLYAIAVSRDAVKRTGWGAGSDFGVNIGSSRGATTLFENFYQDFSQGGAVGIHASPSTTLGNIASWVAQDLRTFGPELSHSITCSTALHAVLNAVAWIGSGLTDIFLAGGSEAPLTPFTLAQMEALKIYSRETGSYPCRALDLEKANNSMVLGEGAGVACLEAGYREDALAHIVGIGYATETLRHGASLSSDARCLQRSMKMALGGLSPEEIDILVMHAPGTLKGDRSEFKAVKKVFGNRIPALTTNKWKIGHTFGASGMLSLEMAVLMMHHRTFIGVPYLQDGRRPDRFMYAMVNAVGFGGNAVSIVIRNPSGA